MNKIAIISLARSGSTTLSTTFETGFKVFHEPIRTSEYNNPKHADIKHILDEYGCDPTRTNTIDLIGLSRAEISPLFEQCFQYADCVKHISTGTYWRATKALIDTVIKLNGKIIFLYREDLFSAILSLLIAEQTNIWQLTTDGVENIEQVKSKFYNTTCEIDTAYFRYMIKESKNNIIAMHKYCKNYVNEKNLQIWSYETLYDQYRMLNFSRICDFIGVSKSIFDEQFVNEIFCSNKVKQITPEYINNILNYQEILRYKERHPDLCTLSFE